MSEILRILHVVVNMNRGGAETFIMNVYRNIDRSKIQFDFLTCKDGVFDKDIREMGGQIYKIPYISEVGPIKYSHELNNFFKVNPQYKIVHSHMDKMSGMVLKAAKSGGIPIRISHSHSTQSEGGFVKKIFKWYAGQFIESNATSFFACSGKASEWLFGNSSGKALIIKNGIELSKFIYSQEIRCSVRRSLGIDETSLVVGHVGRFSCEKNHSFLIDIFREVRNKDKNAVLLLIGVGGLQADVRKKVQDAGVCSAVKFLDLRSDVPDLLQAMDVFVFPSLYEGLPIAIIEAQAAGLKTIVSEAIPDEAYITDLIEKEYLASPATDWAKKVLVYAKGYKRMDLTEIIKSKGYNIEEPARFLQSFYLNEYGKLS